MQMFYQLLKIFGIESQEVRGQLDFWLSESHYQANFIELQKILL